MNGPLQEAARRRLWALENEDQEVRTLFKVSLGRAEQSEAALLSCWPAQACEHSIGGTVGPQENILEHVHVLCSTGIGRNLKWGGVGAPPEVRCIARDICFPNLPPFSV